MTEKKFRTQSGRNATPFFESALSKMVSGIGHERTYRQHVLSEYVLGLGTSLTRVDDVKEVLKENRFYRTLFIDILNCNGPFLDLINAYRNCTFLCNAFYFVKPAVFENGWDNVSCIYGSMKISREEAHFFKNVLNVLGIKSKFTREDNGQGYFVKIYCGSIAILNLKLYTIRNYINKIAKFNGIMPFIRDGEVRFRYLRNPNWFVIVTSDRIYYKGLSIKRWHFEYKDGLECIITPIGSIRVDDYRIYITI